MSQPSPTRRQNGDLTIEPVLLCSARLYSVQISNISNGIIIDTQTHISLNLVSLSSGSLDCKLFFFNLKSSLKKRKRRSNAESCSGFITMFGLSFTSGSSPLTEVHLLQVNVCQKQTALLLHTHYCCLKLTYVLCEGFHVTHVSCLCMLVLICCVVIDMPLVLVCQLCIRSTRTTAGN